MQWIFDHIYCSTWKNPTKVDDGPARTADFDQCFVFKTMSLISVRSVIWLPCRLAWLPRYIDICRCSRHQNPLFTISELCQPHRWYTPEKKSYCRHNRSDAARSFSSFQILSKSQRSVVVTNSIPHLTDIPAISLCDSLVLHTSCQTFQRFESDQVFLHLHDDRFNVS